jgi:glycosyltransferase involved in cell wall biosynthesis
MNITAVVCTFNSEKNILKCINSLIDNNIKEIIIVDGKSTDKTLDLIKDKVSRIFYDDKTGLAAARNLGILHATNKYLLNVGSDNYFPKGSIQKLLNYYEMHNFAGVSMLTKVENTNNFYLAFCMNLYRKIRYTPGEINVIGTPTLFLTKILKDNPYSVYATHSDDEELCTRLNKKYNHKFSIADIYCYESGSDYLSEINDKWTRYGISDSEVYKRNYNIWNKKRKLLSIFYPLKKEFILPLVKNIYSIFILPFLIYITITRYKSWYKNHK